MNAIRKHTLLAVVCITAFVCLVVWIVFVTRNNRESLTAIGKIEKEGDINSIPTDQRSREKLIVGVSGVTGVPFLAVTDGDEMACRLIYEPLMKYNENGKSVFVIASKIDINDSKDTYTLYIDPNRQFSNGAQITPQDIKRSYQLFSDPSIESRYNAPLSYIYGYNEFRNGSSDEITGITVGENFVTFQFVESNRKNLDAFNIPLTNASTLDYIKGTAKTVINEKNLELLGTGQYALDRVDADGIVLSKVDAKKDEFTQVLISPVGVSSVVSLFKTGLLDLYMFDYNTELLVEVEKNPQMSLFSYATSITPYIGINCRNGALSDVNVRKALSFAIKEQPDKARQQFAKSGYSPNAEGIMEKESSNLDLTIITYSAKSYTNDCEYIAELLEASGVRCQVVPLGLSELRERIKKEDFNLYYTKSDVDRQRSVYFMNNEIEGLKNENIEKLKNDLDAEIDDAKYQKIFMNLVKLYEDNMPRIVMTNTRKYVLYSPRLKDMSLDPFIK